MLRNIDWNNRIVSPERIEQSELVRAFRRKVSPEAFEKILRIIDDAIEKVANGNKKIEWCCTGTLLGTNSNSTNEDTSFIWDRIQQFMGWERFCNMTMGSLLQWRISLRSEEWYCCKRETEEWDEDSNCHIYFHEYWIQR